MESSDGSLLRERLLERVPIRTRIHDEQQVAPVHKLVVAYLQLDDRSFHLRRHANVIGEDLLVVGALRACYSQRRCLHPRSLPGLARFRIVRLGQIDKLGERECRRGIQSKFCSMHPLSCVPKLIVSGRMPGMIRRSGRALRQRPADKRHESQQHPELASPLHPGCNHLPTRRCGASRVASRGMIRVKHYTISETDAEKKQPARMRSIVQCPARQSECARIRVPISRRRVRHGLPVFFLVVGGAFAACGAQAPSMAERAANALIANYPAGQFASSPAAEEDRFIGAGLALAGMNAAWYNTANGDYFRYAKAVADAYIDADASGAGNEQTESAVDRALMGSDLLLLYRVTLDLKYWTAADRLHSQLAAQCEISLPDSHSGHPDTTSAGGVCTAEPFFAAYAALAHSMQDYAAITKDFARWEQEIVRPEGEQSGKQTPKSRAAETAFLAASIVDSLEYYPRNDPGRAELTGLLNRLSANALRNPDGPNALLLEPPGMRNPASPSAACFFVYAWLKGVRLGLLPVRFNAEALRIWQSFRERSNSADSNSALPANGANRSLAEDGAFLLASTEADLAPANTQGRGQTVLLDAWFNSQQRSGVTGAKEYFHYKWSDASDSGYSLFGHIWESYGASTETLDSAPTRQKLSRAQFYIIASPDIPVKNPNPHYMTDPDAAEIADWVKQGGVLVLMENDPPNADIAHMNLLADRFGVHFDDVLHHHILGEQVEDGRIPVAAGGPLFRHAHTLYMKDTCAISLREPAVLLLRDRGDVVMAAAKYGRGTVFAAVDPWVYNEYTDGRKNPAIYSQFDNFAGGEELVQWLIEQSAAAKGAGRKESAAKP